MPEPQETRSGNFGDEAGCYFILFLTIIGVLFFISEREVPEPRYRAPLQSDISKGVDLYLENDEAFGKVIGSDDYGAIVKLEWNDNEVRYSWEDLLDGSIYVYDEGTLIDRTLRRIKQKN